MPLVDDPLYREAMSSFETIYNEVRELDVHEPDAMTLCTSDLQGNPTARIVLLRGVDLRGFVFYTNAESRKGMQLSENPQAALCFYWDALRRQIRIEGTVENVTAEENEGYWSHRPRASQIASAASDQSRRLDKRETYEQRIAELEQRLDGKEVPRPDHWHGYRVVPRRIEFWLNRENRMHERTIYEHRDDGWQRFLLFP